MSPELSGSTLEPLNFCPVMSANALKALALVLALGVNLYLLGRISAQTTQYLRYRQEAMALRGEIARLEAVYQARLRQRDYYRSDAYLEVAARENLGLVGPGEKLVVVPAEDRPAASTGLAVATSVPAEPEGNLWARLIALAGGALDGFR